MRYEAEGDALKVTLGTPRYYAGAGVTGRPYSAEEVTELVQVLADGTRITQPQGGQKMWRDSQGRTRTERQLGVGMHRQPGETGSFVLAEVRDSVAGFLYVIDDQAKTARRFTLAARPQPAQRVSPPAGAKVPAFSTEQLGSQNIDGIVAEGTRSTHTMPIGEIGNDRPIVTTNEAWFSRELGLTVMSKNSDPRMGDRTTRLTNVSRAEPDPALFMIPSGYSVVDEKDSVTMILKRQ